MTGLFIGIGIDIGGCWKGDRESRATVEDGEEAWDAGADDAGVDFGEAPRGWKRLVNVELEKGEHKVLPNWTFQTVKLPECSVGAMVTRRMMLTTDALSRAHQYAFHILDDVRTYRLAIKNQSPNSHCLSVVIFSPPHNLNPKTKLPQSFMMLNTATA